MNRLVLLGALGVLQGVGNQEPSKQSNAFHPVERMVSIPLDTSLVNVDSGLSRHGSLFHALQSDKIMFLDASRKVAVRRPTPLPEGALATHMAKFRAGAFWMASQNKVYRLDPYLERWEVRLDPGMAFRQFEVSTNEDIFLIHPEKLGEVERSPKLNVNRRDKASLVFAKRFPRGEDQSDREIELPGDSPAFYELMGDSGGFTRSCEWGDLRLFYDPDTGAMMVLDLASSTIRVVDTPWFCFDLEETYKTIAKHRAKLPLKAEWDGSAGPWLDFQPQSAVDLFLITRITVSVEARRKEIQSKFAEQGIMAHYFPDRTGLPAGIWMVVYRFDQDSWSFKEEYKIPYDRQKHRQPLWYAGVDGLIPLKDHLAFQAEKFRNQKAAEAEAQAKSGTKRD